ncbi:hypothetical protein [Streptomyces sp. 184]|uniref:hypothetical protein n=1 Tax=Streptomyces sp. 184 TaxID=1827526 RepID=UPI00389267A6
MPLYGADGDQRVRIPQPAAPRDAVRVPRPGAGPWDPAARHTRHLRLRLADPARRGEARRLLALVLDLPPLPGADPAVLIAEVPDGRRAVDVLIELAWSGIEVDEFALEAGA